MEKLDFREVNRLIDTLSILENEIGRVFSEEDMQAEDVRTAYGRVLRSLALEDLASISVDELKKSKSGIRTAVLREAGYSNLKQLAEAREPEILAISGVGEKQVEAIRVILSEFISRISENKKVRITGDSNDPAETLLVLSLAKYRRCQIIRRDIKEPAEEFLSFVCDVRERVVIHNQFRWIFSTKQTKRQTLEAVGEAAAFYQGLDYDRIRNRLNLYKEVKNMAPQVAMEDFRTNSAAYYAILEKLGGNQVKARLVYSSIPEKLAAEIDETNLDLSQFLGTLRAYQEFGAKYILHQKRVLLGDEMGLGKTVQAIAAMSHLFADDPTRHFLAVCPASVLVNWCREIEKFSRIPVYLIHGPGMMNALSDWKQDGGVAVTNYESMGKIADSIDEVMRLSMLVVDEAHYIKNPGAKRSRLIYQLEDESERILLMTGTPLENQVEEMCFLIDFIRPDLSDSVRAKAHLSQIPAFRQMLSPCYLRRLRESVLEELPPVEEINVWCSMTPEDRDGYYAALKSRVFPSMRRVSFLQEDMETSSKAQRLLELCEASKAEGRRVVIYSFFRQTIEKCQTLLGEACAGVITGSTKPCERQVMIDRFASDDTSHVLICQIQAGGIGLNIQAASVVIFTEPQIKPSLTNQAISRVYRMGQVNNVLVYHLLCADTVDEAVNQILERKQGVFDAYADESEMAIATEHLIDREWIKEYIEQELQLIR